MTNIQAVLEKSFTIISVDNHVLSFTKKIVSVKETMILFAQRKYDTNEHSR